MKLFIFLLLCLCSFMVHAETRLFGQIEFSETSFLYDRNNNLVDDLLTLDAHYLFHYNNDKNFLLHIDPRLRLDFADENRNRYQPHEAYLGVFGNTVDFRMGLQKITWGNGALFNPVDIVNRSDLESNYILREKLSDPMLSLSFNSNTDTDTQVGFDILVLPLFLETPLPDNNSRFNLSGEQNAITYSLSDSQDQPSDVDAYGTGMALSLQNEIWDIRGYFYHGPEHVPGYALRVDGNGSLELKPFYYTINMLGFTTSITENSVTLKTAMSYKDTSHNSRYPHDIQPVDHDAIPGNNFEYLFGLDYQLPLTDENIKTQLSLEYLGNTQKDEAFASPILLQSDVLLTLKSTSQKKNGTRMILGVLKDIGSKEWMGLTDFSFLLFDEFRLGSQYFYTHATNDSALSIFDNTSYLKGYISYSWGK